MIHRQQRPVGYDPPSLVVVALREGRRLEHDPNDVVFWNLDGFDGDASASIQ